MNRSSRPSRSPVALSDLTGRQLDTVTELILSGLEAQGQHVGDLDPALARTLRPLFDRYLSRRKV